MKIKITKSFSLKLADQVEYIARDKPLAARKFKKDIFPLLLILAKRHFEIGNPSIMRRKIFGN